MELISYLFSFFAVIFWVFRLVVSFAPSINWNLPYASANPIIEIILLFVCVLGLIGIFKRNIFLTAVYLAAIFAYYGYEMSVLFSNSLEEMTINEIKMLLIYGIGILIALLNFLDVLFNKERKGSTKNLNLDWYYDKGRFERDIDERADKNRYRIK